VACSKRALRCATLSLLEPAATAAIAVLVLHGTPPALGWAGMAILLVSLVLLTADSRQQNPDMASTPSPVPTPAVESVQLALGVGGEVYADDGRWSNVARFERSSLDRRRPGVLHDGDDER
jgi:hypothetical protein